MLKKFALTTVATTTLLMAANASALTGVFINGQVGYANQTANSSLGDGSLSDREKYHGAWNATLGYNYDVNEQFNLAAEFGYGYYGRTTWKAETGSVDGFAKIKQSAWLLLFTAGYNFNEMFGAYVKAGPAFGRSNVRGDNTYSFDDGTVDEDFNKTRAMTVLGIKYNFMPELAVNLEWQHIFGSKLSDSKPDTFQTVDAFMAGLTYTFEV